MDSIKFLGKIKLTLILKVTKSKASHSLQSLYFLKHIRVKSWIILNETSMLVFAELTIFYAI